MNSPAAPARNFQCPLCGGDNACAPAGSGSFDTPCWCREVRIDARALARLRPEQRGKACLCRRCAEGPGNDGAAATNS